MKKLLTPYALNVISTPFLTWKKRFQLKIGERKFGSIFWRFWQMNWLIIQKSYDICNLSSNQDHVLIYAIKKRCMIQASRSLQQK